MIQTIVIRKTIRDQRLALIGGGTGIVAFSFYLAWIFPYVSRIQDVAEYLKQMPAFIRNFVKLSQVGTPEGFFNIQPFSILAPLIFIGYAIARGSELVAGEEEKGTLDLLLSYPISRSKLLLQKSIAAAIVFFIWALCLFAGMSIACWTFSIPIHRLRLLAAVFSCLLLAWVFFAMALALGCLTGRKRASAAVVSAFAVVSYLVSTYANLVESLRFWEKFSPFFYYNGHPVMLHGLPLSHALIQAGIIVFFLSLAILFFNRRDVHV